MGTRASFRHPRYEVVRLLGEGGMGRVHLARDLCDGGREVALKVYPARANDERLKREFLALRDLRHPGVARALHFGVTRPAGTPFFTLELIAGEPIGAYLDARADAGPSPARAALAARLFTAIAAAAAYIHRRGVLHLDLKPGNILVVDPGEGAAPRPVLIDFGLVRAARSPAAPVAHATLPFAAPEAFLGEAPSPASDVYSLGATFYGLISGRHPVEASDARSMARAHRTGTPPPLPEAPPALAKVILRALAKDPAHRHRDGGELHAALLQPAVASLAVSAGGSGSVGIAFHEPELVGRTAELEALARWLDGDRRADPVFEVRGEAGMGKSRFLEKAETLIEMRGKNAVALRAPAGGSASIADLCRRHLEVLGAGGRTGKALGASAGDLTGRVAASRLAPYLAADTFLILDDMDAAGPAGEEIVDTAARSLAALGAPPGGGIIVARRPRDGDGGRTGAASGPPPRGVDLGPFALEEALQVDLEGLDGALSSVPPGEARRLKAGIHRQVGGHPLFYVRGLLDLAGDPETAVRLAPTERVLARLRRLDDLERAAAVALAALGRPAAHAEAAGILGLDRGAAGSVLERLRRAGLLADLGRSARIIHASVEEAILADLGPSGRRDAHRRIASFLATSQDRVRLAEGAWHLFESGDAAGATALAARSIAGGIPIPPFHDGKVIPALLRAADAEGEDGGAGGDFLEAAGDALEALGRFEECAAVRSRLAGGLAPGFPRSCPGSRLDATALRRSRKLGSVHHRTGRADLAVAALEPLTSPAAERIAPLEALRARAELALLHHFRGEAGEALEHSRRGIGLWERTPRAERAGALQSAIDLHGIIGQVSLRRLDLEGAIRHFRDGLRLAEKTRSPANLSLLLNNLALANHMAGRFGPALATFERAEAAAKELGDHAALVSIRLNIVQILAKRGRFRAAAEALDSIESMPAAAQSKRLRLVCLHTRGLLLSLLRAESGEVWSSVEALAAEVNDAFLARFARVYRAEEAILRGEYSAARALLAGEPAGAAEPAIIAMKAARLALLEAIAGRAEAVPGLLADLDRAADACPSILRAWNDLHAGIASMETRGWIDARRRLARARKVFRATGFAAGEIECALALADLELRSGAGRPPAARAALREVAAARRVPVEAPSHAAPRSLEARAAVLEARVLLLRAASAGASAAARLPDLLARAAGDPAASFDADMKILLEVLSAAGARLAGDPGRARDAARRLEEAREEAAKRLDAADAAAWLERDPWERFALAAFRPPSGEPRLEPSHAEKLSALLLALGEAPARGVRSGSQARGGPLSGILALVAEGAGASSAEILSNGEVIARWRGDRPARAPPSPGSPRVVLAPARIRGRTAGTLRLVAAGARAFSAGDEAFIAAAARALAPHLAAAAEAPGEGGLERTAAVEKTAGLPAGRGGPVTRRLDGRALRTQAIAEILRGEGVIASGREMQKVLRAVRAYAAADMPVLITGESGTGKNVFARMVHRLSRRADGPFVVQSASAVPPDLFEADLFGYEQGAFTGAERSRTGFLFQALGGTFHLEEIGDLEVALQQRLLRVIEERKVRPLGASAARGLDVRFIASTQRDIDLMVRRGEFRKDLFFRLGAARIHLPPLRQRLDEVPELVRHHWRELTGSSGRFPPAALEVLLAHDWPGNVRELISVLRRLSLEASGPPRPADAEAALGRREARRLIPPALFRSHGLKEVERALEESYLEHLFEKHAGDLAGIAAALGTTTRSIYRRFERLGLKPGDLRRKG